MKNLPSLTMLATLGLLCVLPAAAQQLPRDWQAEIRELIDNKDNNAALSIAESRLAEVSQDLEARGWRARLLAWSNRWSEAEDEYRLVLAAVPNDVDMLLGLADVLSWQQRFDEALLLLDRARQYEPQRPDVHIRRGRNLRSLGRRKEASASFREALRHDPENAQARAGLVSLEEEPRHEFRFGTDFDRFNFAEDAQAATLSLRSQISSRWTTSFTGNFQHRFGQDALRFLASGSYRLSPNDTLTVGGGAGRHNGITPKGESFFEYGHGFRAVSQGLVRGVETSYRQQWLWFSDARVLALTPRVSFYLPSDWIVSLQVTAARSRFSATAAEWRPSGSMRLSFPVHQRLTASAFYGAGTENFALADQIGRFSARTFGGGARFQVTPLQDVTFYTLYQDRSQDRSQTSIGFSYGFRF